jgi:hypothetical protein
LPPRSPRGSADDGIGVGAALRRTSRYDLHRGRRSRRVRSDFSLPSDAQLTGIVIQFIGNSSKLNAFILVAEGSRWDKQTREVGDSIGSLFALQEPDLRLVTAPLAPDGAPPLLTAGHYILLTAQRPEA